MTKTFYATYDGEVLRPERPVTLARNARVRVTVETKTSTDTESSFLEAARSLKLDGPSDWSDRLEDYLYGHEDHQS